MKKLLSKIKNAIVNAALAVWNYGPFAATRGYIINKFISVAIFALMMAHYKTLPSQPFIELYYVAITVFGVALLGPLLRLVLFAEAAEYAESGGLKRDLEDSYFSLSYRQYRFATAISYMIPVLCFATISK